MTIGLRGWRRIEKHAQSGETWYGRKRLRSYTANDLALSPELEWFRDAVQDVRKSMDLAGGELLVQELLIYEELAAIPPTRESTWLRALRDYAIPPLRQRRGMVRYGERSKLYLSRKGWQTPRIVYEEVAHSLLRALPITTSDRRSNDPDLERYIEALLRGNPQMPPQVVHWPTLCHLDIFRGFLNDSEAYRHSEEVDRQFARTQVARLETVLRCRRLGSPSRSECPCSS